MYENTSNSWSYLKAHLLRATLSMKVLVWVCAARVGLATILKHLAEAAIKDILSRCGNKSGYQKYRLFY